MKARQQKHEQERREERARQDSLERRIARAESGGAPLPPVPPPQGRGGRGGDRRGQGDHERDRRGQGEYEREGGDDRRGGGGGNVEGKKGQCGAQLRGRCDTRKCPYQHKNVCPYYRDSGREGCRDFKKCGLLHPWDCKSVDEGWICDDKQCKAWHDGWEFKRVGTPINPQGAWNGGSFQQPPKGFERAPGRKEKKENNERKEKGEEEGNGNGAPKKEGLREKVEKNAETLELVSRNLEQLAYMQGPWYNQWGNQGYW